MPVNQRPSYTSPAVDNALTLLTSLCTLQAAEQAQAINESKNQGDEDDPVKQAQALLSGAGTAAAVKQRAASSQCKTHIPDLAHSGAESLCFSSTFVRLELPFLYGCEDSESKPTRQSLSH